MGLTTLTALWERQCILIRKWLWCKRNLVLNLTNVCQLGLFITTSV